MEEQKKQETSAQQGTQDQPYLEPLETAKDIQQALEAILFAAGYPVRYDKLAEVLNLSVKDVKTMLKELSKQFTAEKSVHGIQLMLFTNTAQLCTKERFAPYIREALGIRRGGNLSASSMEVLAVIAYNQPVTRTFVDTVRGMDSSYAVNSLLDKGLIEAAGRLDAPGRPMLYITSDKFLRVFGINSLSELPQTEALSVAAAQMEQNENLGEQLAISDDDIVPEGKEYTEAVDSEETDVIFESGAAPVARENDADQSNEKDSEETDSSETEEPESDGSEELV